MPIILMDNEDELQFSSLQTAINDRLLVHEHRLQVHPLVFSCIDESPLAERNCNLVENKSAHLRSLRHKKTTIIE